MRARLEQHLVGYGLLSFGLSSVHNLMLVYHVDAYINAFKIGQAEFMTAEVIFMVWNCCNDLIWGWLSDMVWSGPSNSQLSGGQAPRSRLQLLGRRLSYAFCSCLFERHSTKHARSPHSHASPCTCRVARLLPWSRSLPPGAGACNWRALAWPALLFCSGIPFYQWRGTLRYVWFSMTVS